MMADRYGDDPWRFLGGMLEHRFDRLESMLRLVIQKENIIMKEVDDIIAEIEPLTSAVDGMEAAMDGLIAAVEANKADPVKLQAALNAFRSQKDQIVAAALRGTAAVTPPPGQPPVPPVDLPPA